MIYYGANVFYAKLDIDTFFNHGHDLFLTDNGVVLCYEDIAPMYLTFHYRPPHEQDPGGLKHEEKQRAAGASSSFEEATPSAAADSSEATGGSPSGEVPARRVQQKAMPKKKAKAKASADAESATGGSPSGEVPVVDEAAVRRLIREDELREAAARRSTTSEGTARYAYEAGDTVHGRVDATRLQQEEELRDIIQKARYNPWHFFHHGLVAHSHLPLTYMIVDINQGKTLPQGSQGSGTMRDQVPKASLTAPLTRAGMNSMRVCVLHLSSHVASGQVSLPHEALATMFIDCLFYQVDFIGGDPNMALYRYSGTKQGSMDIQGGMYQSIITYFLEGWKQSPRIMPFCTFRERSIAAQTVFCSLNNTRMLLAAVPTRTVQRSIGILFLVSILWLPPFWNGATRVPMTNGQTSPRTPRSSS